MAVYYIDGTNLSNSTAVYDDEELTVCSADGYYSNGGIVRQLVNCVLQSQQTCTGSLSCPIAYTVCYSDISAAELCCRNRTEKIIYISSDYTFDDAPHFYDDEALTTISATGWYSDDISGGCASVAPVPCGTGITPPSGGMGLYNLTFDAGGTVSDVGAVVIYFDPRNFPDGIRVQYDGVFYNALSSPTEGLRQSTSGVADAFTILGDPSNTCVPATPNTTIYDYFDGFSGGTWDAGTPTTQSITINTGDDVRGGQAVFSTIVIPKTTATPNTLNVQVLGPCSGTQWYIDVNCPTALPSFSSSVNQGSSLGCVAETETYYFAQHKSGTNSFPIITNWVFSDSSGEFVLSDGNYVMSNSNVITVVSGIVTAIVACS